MKLRPRLSSHSRYGDDPLLRRWRRVLAHERALALGGGGGAGAAEPLDALAAHRCQAYAYRAARTPTASVLFTVRRNNRKGHNHKVL